MKRAILFFVSVMIVIGGYAQTTWSYPLKPDMPEWAQFDDHSKMLEVCQIPNDILKSVSTTELVTLCLDYPLQFDFFCIRQYA